LKASGLRLFGPSNWIFWMSGNASFMAGMVRRAREHSRGTVQDPSRAGLVKIWAGSVGKAGGAAALNLVGQIHGTNREDTTSTHCSI
jgi:hypothetical protein